MNQKTPTFSKPKKPPQTRNLTLSDGTEVCTNDNKRSHIKKGHLTKHDYPDKKFSTETGMGHEDWFVDDDLDESEYPPPSTHPVFRKFWAENIGNITGRDNFNLSHLGLFEALCMLRVELRALDTFIMENGHTFRVVTVLGDHRKTYPEVNERMKVLAHIANYSRLLDLVPKKDKARGRAKKAEIEEWG